MGVKKPMAQGLDILDPNVQRWAALRTSSRWEKQVAAALRTANVPVFLPTVKRVTTYQNRKVEAEMPLFLGYVFCSETDFLGNPAVPAATRKKVAQILKTPEQELLRAELEEISRFIQSHGLVQEKLYGQPGERVRIIRGSFTGLEGKIVRLKPGRKQIVLHVSLIGGAVEVDLDETSLEKI